MSDRKQDNGNGGDSKFDRELAVMSRAYKNAGADTPPPATDDAIRAAARRAVRSQPQAAGKSWISRWSAPLSAAALVVLTVSVGFLAIDEQPGLAPEPLKAVVKANPPASPDASAMSSNASASAAPGAVVVPRLSLPAPNTSAESVANEAQGFVADPPLAGAAARKGNVVAAGTAKREAAQEKLQSAPAAVPARGDASLTVQKSQAPTSPAAATSAPIVASPAAISPPRHVAAPTLQSLADKANEPPEAWVKRILEFKQQGKTREFDEELAKFRKRYPDFKLPEELRERK